MTTPSRPNPRPPFHKLLAPLAIAAALVAPAAALAAKAGDPDKRFGGDGTVLRDLGADDSGDAIAVQRDRKVVTATGVEFRGDNAIQVNRFLTNGRLDKRFGNDGRRILALPGDEYDPSIDLAAKGKIVIAFSADTNDARLGVARLNRKGNPDGSLDGDGIQTVGYGADVDSYGGPTDVAVTADDDIVVTSYAIPDNSDFDYDFGAVRLNPNGSLNENFGDGGRTTVDFGGGADDEPRSIAIDGQGRIVLAGESNMQGTGRQLAVARLTAQGEPDAGFAGDDTTTSQLMRSAADVTALSGGALAMAGTASGDYGVVKLAANGAPDGGFSDDGLATVDFADSTDSASSIANDGGRLVLAGGARTQRRGFDFGIARLTAAGDPDRSFSDDGRKAIDFGKTADEANGVAVDARGSIVAGGQVQGRGGSGDRYDTGLVRLLGKRG